MTRREFWSIVLTSSAISAALVLFFLRWPSPPSAEAEAVPPVLTEPVSTNIPVTEDERINTRIYDERSKGVVNVISTNISWSWFRTPVQQEGVGTGFIVDDEGHIVTNYHVIEGAESLDVTLYDQSKHEAKVVGVDRQNDIAVIKIECPSEGCFPVPLGDSDQLKVGQKVLAIGNPFGLNLTMTSGIVSSLGRVIETGDVIVDDVIQTDAAINRGNSGGPLFDAAGTVVGVNTLIYSRSGDSAGIGFAVPINTVRSILPDLLQHGKVLRPWLGIRSAVRLFPRLAESLELPVDRGLLIETVERGSSLDRAGLRGGDTRVRWRRYILVIGGDVLTEIDGKPVVHEKDIKRALIDKRPGDRVQIVYYRDGRRLREEIELVGRNSSRRFRF